MKDNTAHTPKALNWQCICAYLLLSMAIVLGLYVGLNQQLQSSLDGTIWLFALASLTVFASTVLLHRVFVSMTIERLTTAMEHQPRQDATEQASPPSPADLRTSAKLPATVDNDIRTPMNGIIGMTNKLLESSLSDDQKRYMMKIQEAASTLNKIIDNIQNAPELEPPAPALEEVPFNLVQTIESCINLLAEQAQAKHLALYFCMMSGVPQQVRGDAGRLKQVLANLLANAIVATDAGTVAINVSSDLEGRDRVKLRFDIHSTAMHINSEVIPNLSATFPHINTASGQFAGTPGLERLSSEQLVQPMQGRIEVQSLPDTGAIWRLSFSLGLGPNPDTATTPLPLQNMPILYVDSSELNSSLMFNQFAAWGMAPTTTADAASAITALNTAMQQKNPFPLVVIRHDPATLDGYALCREIRRTEAATAPKILLLTAAGQGTDPLASHASSFDASLTFPIRVTTLHHALLQVVDHPSELEPEPTPSQSAERTSSGAALNILLVEDNHVNQQVALSMLKKWGHNIDVAWNGLEALAAVQKQDYDLVLMDIQMPEMDGVTATQRIRQLEGKRASVPIVAVTANAMQGDRERFLEAGMDDYIAKPINRDAFYMVVHRYTPQHPAVQAEQSVETPTSDAVPPVLGDEVLSYLLNELSGETVSELIDEYMTHSSALLSQALTASEVQDAKNIEYAVHTLKGMSGALGAFRMVDICQHILDTCRREGAQQIGDQMTGLSGATEEAQQALRAWRSEHEHS